VRLRPGTLHAGTRHQACRHTARPNGRLVSLEFKELRVLIFPLGPWKLVVVVRLWLPSSHLFRTWNLHFARSGYVLMSLMVF
jgi:hypothetical protein